MATERIDIVVSERGARTVKRNLEEIGQSGQKAGSGVALLQKALQGLAVGAALTFLQRQADLYTNIQNRLQLVTTSTANLAAVNDKLFASANRTYASYEATADLYSNLAQSTTQLGLSQSELLQITETVNQAVRISGTETATAAQGIRQLGQAMASGVLRGDELNSVLENMPRLAMAIATGMGVSRGELRALAADGKVTSEALTKALIDQGPLIAEEFARLTPTISNTFQVLSNNVTRFIGELNQASGVGQVVGRVILFLANNLRGLAVLAAGVGAALVWRSAAASIMGVLGPMIALNKALGAGSTLSALYSIAIKGATGAMRTFTASLLANPFTALLVVLTLLTAAFVNWGDQIKVTADGAVSLKDAFFAALSFIGDAVRYVTSFFQEAWSMATGWVTQLAAKWGVDFSDILSSVGSFVKAIVNAFIGAWVAAYNLVTVAWNNFPGFMDVIFTSILNLAASAAEAVLNAWQVPLKFIANGLSMVNDEAGAALGGFIDSFDIKVPRAKLNAAGRAAAGAIGDGMKSAFSTDYVGNAWTAVVNRARQNGAGGAEAALGAGLPAVPGAGSPDKDKGGDKGSTAETRADFLAKVNRETSNSIQLAQDMNFEWQKTNEDLTSIDEQLIDRWGQKAKLSETERVALGQKLKLMYDEQAIQEKTKRLYEEFSGPQKDMEEGHKAIQKVLAKYPQYTDEANAALRRLRIEYLSTKKDLASGLELGKLQVQSDNENVGRRVAASYVSEYRAVNDGMLEIQDRAAALKQLMQDDPIHSGQYAERLRELGIEALQMRVNLPGADAFDALKGGLASFVADFKGVLPGLQQAFGNTFNRIGDGIANALARGIVYGENMGKALKEVAASALTELLSALIKLGIQWVVMQVIGQTAQAAIGATGIAMGAATAAAWAPAAAAVSLATFGANAAPAMAGIGATYALTTALSVVKGFKDGGFTGRGGKSDIAGVVHGQEFVMNAEATAQWLPILEAMNSGRMSGYQSGGYTGGPRSAPRVAPAGVLQPQGGGDSGAFNINIDARGAEDGVERKIEEALDQALPFFLAKARNQEAKVNQAASGRRSIGSVAVRRR